MKHSKVGLVLEMVSAVCPSLGLPGAWVQFWHSGVFKSHPGLGSGRFGVMAFFPMQGVAGLCPG